VAVLATCDARLVIGLVLPLATLAIGFLGPAWRSTSMAPAATALARTVATKA